jgi:hypothetical protein
MAYYRAGLGNAASYQSSGVPFASGSIDASGAPTKISFPHVTRWVVVQNHDATADLICAFSEKGLPSAGGTNFFTIEDVGPTYSQRLELKVTEMWFEGSANFDVIAGLTGISTLEIANNWSGSAGVG